MMLLPLTQCLRVDQLRASFQKHVSEIIRNINDDICSLVVGIIWRGILVMDKGKGPLFFSKNYFHVGTTVPLKAAQVALNLARVFSTIKNKQKVFAGLTSPIFFEFWQNFAQFFWSLLRVIQILWQNNLGVAMWVFCIRHHTDTGNVHKECLVSCNDHGLAVRLSLQC